ncbi:MAG: hypothetical protein RL308_2042 [Bacteroidota bacterium]|jgi:hypothetical protein
MKKQKFLNTQIVKFFVFAIASLLFISCEDFERDFADERYLTDSQATAISSAGGTVGLKALDGAILSYLRDGEAGETHFGIKGVDLGMDLRSGDMDMSANTHFGRYNNYSNVVGNSVDNEFMWKFFYKVINNANSIINTIPDGSSQTTLDFKYKSYAYRAIAYFYLIRIYQHTTAADNTIAIPIDFGDFVGQPKSTVGEVKAQILKDLNLAYNGLKNYNRASNEEIDASVVAAYLARYHLTYKNWAEAENYADIAMNGGSISSSVSDGFDDLALSEVLWGANVTESTSEVYASFFSHISQINDGYSGWNHVKTINSNLFNQIPSTDKRRKWFAEQQYADGVVIVPGTWAHYDITPKYTSLKFISDGGPGTFNGDYIYLRNTEFFLTKAEALARQGKDSEARQVLFNLNTMRDPSYSLSTKSGQSLIDEILLYRKIELWGEGVAFFDMARNGVGLNRKDGRENPVLPGADLVIPALDVRMIYPIPTVEVDAAK